MFTFSQMLTRSICLQDIRESVMRFKQEIMQVHSIFLFPFSFVNYHFVHMLLVCYVCLVAYVFVLNIEPSVMGIPIYFFTVLPFLVTTEIANGLSSPFGKDLMSFNIEVWRFARIERACVNRGQIEV